MSLRRLWPAVLLSLLLLPSVAGAQVDPLSLSDHVGPWKEGLAETREVVDRLVVCFDGASFLAEVAKWDEKRFWPVLLWEPDFVPKFVAAFRPGQLLLAEYAKKDEVSLEAGLRAVADAWGAEMEKTDPAAFLAVLSDRGRKPMGAVLLAGDSPELLGGVALAAGRFQLPLEWAIDEKHNKRVSYELKEDLRKTLAKKIGGLEIEFAGRFDDLDFVTVANDMTFAYTPPPDAHPAAYTIDDAIARNDDLTRWGYVGRLVGGPARSVYMAMGALFLQPESGLFFSRYNPKNQTFGAFDPEPAMETFGALFPTEAIRHPDATLAKWREVQWPNRHGFIYVNSSGGATSWSTSKGGATHFDVPDTVPTVVHYTHSGSAGRPFDVDSIAGRWMANGAYVYFGSHAEPYLTAFVPPRRLASRVKVGVPLGAAMRHPFSPRMVARRKMKVGGVEKSVSFNLSGPWKLAYFGDPTYRLTGKSPARVAPEEPGKGYFTSRKAHGRLRPKDPSAKLRHLVEKVDLVRLDPSAKKLADPRAWAKLVRRPPEGQDAIDLMEAMIRVWIASLRATPPEKLYDAKQVARLAGLPAPIAKLAGAGAVSTDSARLLSEFAKEYVSGIARHPDSTVGRQPAHAAPVLALACAFPHSKGSQKVFFTWLKAVLKDLGMTPATLKKSVLANKWLSAPARKAAEANLK